MPSKRAFEAKVAAFFRDRELSLDAPALLGLSGGPDSTALLAALHALGAGPIRALHVDHGIRPEAERRTELELVRASCERLGVPLSLARVRPGAVRELALSSGEGLEAAARRFRLSAFSRCRERFGLERLYLAHTRDDRLETLLMRLLGGSGTPGLGGILTLRPPIFRPFLSISKAEILEYLAERGLAYSIDSTNADESLLRNRIRGRLLPLLKASFPGWERGLELVAEKALRDEVVLGGLAEKLRFAENEAGGLCLSSEVFFAAPEAIRLRALVEACGRLGGAVRGGGRASSRLAAEALAVISRAEVYRGGGIEFKRSKGLITLGRHLDFKGPAGYFLEIDRPGEGTSLLRAGRLRAAVAWVDGPEALGLLEGAFAFPLLLRSRRPGDSLSLRSGSKAVDELLSEWGIPPELRDAVPVLEDREGIVAVLGAAAGGRDRYRHRDGLPTGGRRLSIVLKGA